MKMIHGAASLAVLKRSLTLEAPTPTNISINSAADIEMNGTPASPATALASKVLPVPGGPISKHPLGIFAPRSVYLSGYFKKSTISVSSSFASSIPATWSNFTPVSGTIYTFAFDFPILNGLIGLFIKSLGLSPDLNLLKIARPPKNIKGKANWDKSPKRKFPVLSAGITDKSILLS